MRKNARMAIFLVAAVGLLVAPLAFGSNMGFKLERTMAAVPGGLSYYPVSLPFYRSVQDLWNTAAAGFTPTAGTDNGVGEMWSDDLLADWWTNGDGTCDGSFPSECVGSITILRFINLSADPGFNTWKGQTIARNPITGNPVMSGVRFDVVNDPATDPDGPGQGFLVTIPNGSFPVIIVGSENPDVPTYVMPFVAGGLNKHPYSHLYHSTYVTSQDLLTDLATATGSWEGGVSILDFINDSADPAFNTWKGQTIAKNPITGNPTYSGTPFNLVPGNGYVFVLNGAPPAGSTTISLPHY